MAYDELQRDPPQLMADFIEHTRDACWDLQFYLEWRLNHGLEPEPVISAFTNVLVAFRRVVRAGAAPDGEIRAFDVDLAIRANALARGQPHFDSKILRVRIPRV